jgi:hypothetical protein
MTRIFTKRIKLKSMGNEKLIFYLRTNKYYSIFLIIMVTFFVIATKKVTERHPERMRRISIWRTLRKIRCFADAQHDGQTRSLRAFCLASTTHFVFKLNTQCLCDSVPPCLIIGLISGYFSYFSHI